MKAPSILILSNDGRVVLNDLAVSLCPNLKRLKSEELLYIILAYDWINSPYRLRAPEERRKLAVIRCWPNAPDLIPEDQPRLGKAIEEFQSLLFNHNYYYRDRLLSKMITMEEELTRETTASKIKGLMDTMDLISRKIDELNDKIMQRESELELKGGGSLTWVEQWQINREEFNKRGQAI